MNALFLASKVMLPFTASMTMVLPTLSRTVMRSWPAVESMTS